jgi:hypothetical protein
MYQGLEFCQDQSRGRLGPAGPHAPLYMQSSTHQVCETILVASGLWVLFGEESDS